MTGIPSSGGTGANLSIGPALAKLRRDNALSDEVHDPSEDEPRIVSIPEGHEPQVEAPRDADVRPAPPHRSRWSRWRKTTSAHADR